MTSLVRRTSSVSDEDRTAFGRSLRPACVLIIVLLTVEEYQKLTEGQKSIVDLLGMPQAAEVEFKPPRMKDDLHQPADLT
jgi:hypothetical protein